MKHTEKVKETDYMIKGLLSDEEIKRQMEEEKYFYDRTITKYKDIRSYNECDDDEYVKKIGNKYVFFDGEEKFEEFETLKEVEDYLYDAKENELGMINNRLRLLDENYFYARASILYKNLLKKDSSEMSLELKEWIKKWIKKRINIRNDIFVKWLLNDENVMVGNYLYLKIKDDDCIYDGMYDRIDINTLEEELVEDIDYDDFLIREEVK